MFLICRFLTKGTIALEAKRISRIVTEVNRENDIGRVSVNEKSNAMMADVKCIVHISLSSSVTLSNTYGKAVGQKMAAIMGTTRAWAGFDKIKYRRMDETTD